ncbi:MAG TPA: acetylornithine/succinylornithine family transaminase [Opitutales bacterium]|nr:acetylornithine/succinylornithine family transaminase [Opitutales bacterium]
MAGDSTDFEAYLLGNYAKPALTLVRGAGLRVWDAQGREYLDFAAGIAVTGLGHCHPTWVKRVQEQAATLAHCSNYYRNLPQGRLAQALVGRIGPGKIFFCNSGAEANETILKLARLHGRALENGVDGKRYKVLCAKNAFHGRTFGGMAATPQEKIQNGFRPMLEGFAFGEINNLASFEKLVDGQTAAIFVETIQGESGIHTCTPEFLRGLRALCDRHNLLLMIDEVQCGIGRTGKFLACAHAGIAPDAVGLAKGLGGGFPIGAVWIAEKYAPLFTPGSHGNTFGGNPLACAAALAVLEVMDGENLIDHVNTLAPVFHQKLRALAAEVPHLLTEVRGQGFMIGLQLAVDQGPLVAALREAGLLVVASGSNTVRLLPALTATAADLDAALAILRRVLVNWKPTA